MTNVLPGYHLTAIQRGVYGQSSKLREEIDEIADAEAQGARIMLLVELSDLIGAVKGYLATHFPDFTLADLETMADITHRAFANGHRS